VTDRLRIYSVAKAVDVGVAETLYEMQKVAPFVGAFYDNVAAYIEHTGGISLTEDYAACIATSLSWSDACGWAATFSEQEVRAAQLASGSIRSAITEALTYGLRERILDRVNNSLYRLTGEWAPVRENMAPVRSWGAIWFGSVGVPLIRLNFYASGPSEGVRITRHSPRMLSLSRHTGLILRIMGHEIETVLTPSMVDLVNADRIETYAVRKLSDYIDLAGTIVEATAAGVIEIIDAGHEDNRAILGI
jgi:hypothetical protein